VHVVGKEYADNMWAVIEARSHPVSTPPEGTAPELHFLVTKKELSQIKNDCAYPERESCIGCPGAEGVDDTRASGLGCNFMGANLLEMRVLMRPVWQHDAAIEQAARENVLDEIDTWLDSWLKGCSLSGTEAMRVCDFFGYLRKHKE
jgi:hypothetical protein